MSGQIHQVIKNSYLFSGLDPNLIGRIANAASAKSLAALKIKKAFIRNRALGVPGAGASLRGTAYASRIDARDF